MNAIFTVAMSFIAVAFKQNSTWKMGRFFFHWREIYLPMKNSLHWNLRYKLLHFTISGYQLLDELILYIDHIESDFCRVSSCINVVNAIFKFIFVEIQLNRLEIGCTSIALMFYILIAFHFMKWIFPLHIYPFAVALACESNEVNKWKGVIQWFADFVAY